MPPAPTNAAIIADLNRAKTVFQLRAICAAIGLPHSPAGDMTPPAMTAPGGRLHPAGRALSRSFHDTLDSAEAQ